jgi:hypothetical protein
LRLGRLKVSDREDPFAAIIRCTADPAKGGEAEQVEPGDALRVGVQGGLRALGTVRPAQRRHQRLCCSVLSAA